MDCKVRLLDEVTAVIVGLHGDHLEHLYNKFAVPAANYFFHPRFKLGQWDGKIRYFQKTGRTFIYLLEDILPRLVKFGYKVTIEDLRTTSADPPGFIDNQLFAHVPHLDTGLPTILRDDQVEAVNKLIEAGSGVCLAGTGAGKAQALDSLVLTPTGWVKMGDLRAGDTVITPKNTRSKIVGVYPQGKKDLFRVHFHDGSSTLCCADHLWTVNMPEKWYRANTKKQTVDLRTIASFLREKQDGGKCIPGNIIIPVIEPVEFDTPTSVPVDPYLLGVLIGDGSLSTRSITVSTADRHILNRVADLVSQYQVSVKHALGVDYRLTKMNPQDTFPPSKNALTEAVDALGLMGTTSSTKFIPWMYLNASIDTRTRLVQGLFDTDGTVDRRGNVSYTTTSHTLAAQVQYLLRSLGASCTITARTSRYNHDGTEREGVLAYTLFVASRDTSRFFTLPRKVERCRPYGHGRIQHGRRIVSVIYERTDDAQCIAIDDPDHLYITDDFIVTHNTLMCSALVQAYDRIDVKSLTIVPDQGLIRQTKAEYINCGLDTGEYSGLHKTLEHQHIVSTWQALQNNPKIVEMFQLVIVDECHGLRGNVLTKIICDHAARLPYRFGFTGTLPKDEAERMSVHVAVGPVRHTMAARTLIDMGVLADIHIDVIQLEEDLRAEYTQFCKEGMPGSKPPTYVQFKDGYFPDFASEKSYLHRKESRIEWIAEFLLAKQDSKKGNVLCLVDSIPFGRKLAEYIPNAIFVNGQDIKTAAKRQEVYDLFKTRNDLVVIATVHIAGTGLNIRRIFNLVFVDIGKSFTRVIQGIGRGLRKADDKDSVIVTDICSDLKYGKKHSKMRTNYYEEAQYPFKKHKIDYIKQMDPLADFEQ